MSKTTKTAPLWVRANANPGNLQAQHHHENGRECDLPAKAQVDHDMYRGFGRRCMWVPTYVFLFSGPGACACSRCSSPFWQKAANRTARYAGQQYARAGWRTEY